MNTFKKKLLDLKAPVKSMADSAMNSVISLMVDKAFKENVKLGYFEDTGLNQKKLSYIKMLIQASHLDWPTQALILDWMDQTLDEYEQLIASIHDQVKILSFGRFNTVVEQECHLVSSYNWVMHHNEREPYRICIGYSDRTNWHSWLLDQHGNLFESTPIIRDQYFGYVQTDPLAVVEEDLPGIVRLFEAGRLNPMYQPLFMAKYNKLVKESKAIA